MIVGGESGTNPEYFWNPKADWRKELNTPGRRTMWVGWAAKLREWRKKNPSTKLVFGTEADKVYWHFWRACKRIAEKAGFDPSNWWVHKFRDTFATRTLEKRPDLLRTLQSWMGHSSITMTQRYLADAEGQVQQQGINDVFGGGKQQMALASEPNRAFKEAEKTSSRQGANVSRKGPSITPKPRAVAVMGTPAF